MSWAGDEGSEASIARETETAHDGRLRGEVRWHARRASGRRVGNALADRSRRQPSLPSVDATQSVTEAGAWHGMAWHRIAGRDNA
ncbi:hypothetical protein ColLi_11734 [Colletotrichum liriopes]|uniref:Uncharacterized protein n=1 Tax=Colletotrichum liriopes TaxID=708192 RepID=A0AA37GYU0_9PEZI|nr:hypothetical protein ColLi_11734 [Colletotrichum liriopes]